jgi:hypothetical protein
MVDNTGFFNNGNDNSGFGNSGAGGNGGFLGGNGGRRRNGWHRWQYRPR